MSHLLPLCLPLFCIYALPKESCDISSVKKKKKHYWDDPHKTAALLKLIRRNSARRTVNIICSLDLQYCLYVQNYERNTRGMLSGFCFTFGTERKSRRRSSNQPQHLQPFVCVNHGKKWPLSRPKLHLLSVHPMKKLNKYNMQNHA